MEDYHIFMGFVGTCTLILFATLVYICAISFGRDDDTPKCTTVEGTGNTEKSTVNSKPFIKADVEKAVEIAVDQWRECRN